MHLYSINIQYTCSYKFYHDVPNVIKLKFFQIGREDLIALTLEHIK